MIRTAIYARVSTEKQKKEGDSIAAQVSALREYINERDDHVNVGEYIDDGISGTKIERDQLQKLLDDVKAGGIDKIIFCKIDRWFRSIRHYINTQELLDKCGCNWLAIWEPIYDSSTAQGRLIINQMMSIAQFEAENTGQRIRQVFDYKRSKGEVLGGRLPYGYTAKDKILVPDENAQNVVDIFRHFVNTGSITETMRYASNQHGYSVSRKALKNTLTNKIYIGMRGNNQAYCQPIIDQDLWNSVQRGIKSDIKCSAKTTYVFAGILFCDNCGCRLVAATRSTKGKKYQFYRCKMRYNRTKAVCPNGKSLSEKQLERTLLDSIPTMIEEKRKQFAVEAETRPDPSKRIAAIKRKIDRLKDLYIAEEINLDEYKKDKAEYMKELEALEEVKAEPQKDYSKILTLFTPDLKDKYWTWEREERRAFWRQIIKEIRFDKDRNITVEFL